MGKFSNWFLTGFAALFLIPSTLVIISWNAIPGDSMYSLKTGLEDILLTSISGTALASNVSIKYTERRFDEATILLDRKGSTTGYSLLVAEAKDSQKIITEKQDLKQKEELVAKIENYKREIQQKQTNIQSGQDHIPVVADQSITSTSTTEPTQSEEVEVVQAQTEQEVIEDLEVVIEELEEIQEDIEHQLPEQASFKAQENAGKKEKEYNDPKDKKTR